MAADLRQRSVTCCQLMLDSTLTRLKRFRHLALKAARIAFNQTRINFNFHLTGGPFRAIFRQADFPLKADSQF
ncbi:MAG: hypothetical protein ACKOEO_06430, partial [Planctomycetaceae bacterium]